MVTSLESKLLLVYRSPTELDTPAYLFRLIRGSEIKLQLHGGKGANESPLPLQASSALEA